LYYPRCKFFLPEFQSGRAQLLRLERSDTDS
jgi:hypothetical protein